MDPNRLSMEQGKEFLKQLGIPQRDIDSMTEKWVVDAAVEVLLRFPLMPGEDPGGRCVSSKKCQPSVDRLTASQRHKDQEERKSNNQVLKENDQRPKDMGQMARHYIHQRPIRLPMTPNLKKLQKGPVGQRNPPPQEENTRVKCENCGAFGHLASSRRCPMKCWGGALAPQPLGSSPGRSCLGKVHRGFGASAAPKPGRRLGSGVFLVPSQWWRPGSGASDTSRDLFRRQEERKEKDPPRKLPGRPQRKPQSACREPADSGAHLRRPTRPLPVQTNTKPSVLGPVPTCQPPARTADMRSSCPTRPLYKAPEVRACEPARRCGADLPCEDPKSSCRDQALISKSTAGWPEVSSRDVPPSARKTLALGPVCHRQAQAKHPPVDSKPRPQPATGTHGQSSKVSIQAQGKRSPQVPVQPSQNPPKKARFNFF
ncbi:protein FAM90A27P-like [Leopardus geoffroyi]|uniref:protein FAM90A27P-like n=1 Tax=Leopardus geoffroyi TaxID=46844 RepID=UPI001E263CBC|nr:protein FAM90A27P-like [Leopardus geoffroyi]